MYISVCVHWIYLLTYQCPLWCHRILPVMSIFAHRQSTSLICQRTQISSANSLTSLLIADNVYMRKNAIVYSFLVVACWISYNWKQKRKQAIYEMIYGAHIDSFFLICQSSLTSTLTTFLKVDRLNFNGKWWPQFTGPSVTCSYH